MKTKTTRLLTKSLAALAASIAAFAVVASMTTNVTAQQPKPVKVAVIVPLSGPWARTGTLIKMGAEMAVAEINQMGGIKALGGAKMQLVSADAGDTAEKAKNAAQRLIAQEQIGRASCRERV